MGTLMLEHGVHYGQAVISTEVQQQDTTLVQIRGAIPPNHAPPGITVIAHMGVEVPQQNYGVPSRSTFQHPPQGLQEGWVLHTAVRPTSRNNSETHIPGLKAQGNNPLVYRGKLQHLAAELSADTSHHGALQRRRGSNLSQGVGFQSPGCAWRQARLSLAGTAQPPSPAQAPPPQCDCV
ncbi:hypothetical protein QTP86_010644 [Hemibagrus guttatus]|nr:hypothetical protein QTP86_010644 [Hemibagrus guttatus]